ncbi:BTB/POZ and MATH domain-containing protein 1-like [Triticum aestivum]|uniref:Uncharacterized protein n=1 Tax=Triticum turgidum subsp. durum TaxID=4567 RepID=A0A9R0YGI6_TRITD|nr:BTB/POZ and MATH domain-containing protein 1-like [Triticum aestivum]VAI54998.1 unnamed protein product [Triticum turgidum subsp. durum]
MAANETASTHRLSSTTGVHLLKVAGHSLIKGASTSVESKPFRVGGHDWVVEYYPYGNKNAGEQHTSVFINLENPGEAIVRANYSFCLQGPGSPVTGEKTTVNGSTHDFSAAHKSYGFSKFVRKADLTKWGYLNDDCLLIKCTVEIISSDIFEGHGDDDTSVVVPPSELTRDIGKILDDGLKADMTVKIGWFRRFKVHACVLAARSPVFRAQLCGSMVESRRSSIRVRGICASVFEALLYYMYKDTLPPFMEEATEEATNMAQHLLVAADRYAMERLKLSCESKLSKALDAKTVGFTVDFAERHNCQQLKNCCVKYMARTCEE